MKELRGSSQNQEEMEEEVFGRQKRKEPQGINRARCYRETTGLGAQEVLNNPMETISVKLRPKEKPECGAF